MAVQESVIGFHNDPVLLMASPMAAEGMTAHLDQRFMDALRACVQSWGYERPDKATMFWSSHINTDGGESGHWQNTLDTVGRFLRSETDLQRFIGVMKTSMAALTRSYDSYVTDLSLFGASAQPEPPEQAGPARVSTRR